MTVEKCPSIEDLHDAKGLFLRDEPRNLFYRIATELIDITILGNTQLIIYPNCMYHFPMIFFETQINAD